MVKSNKIYHVTVWQVLLSVILVSEWSISIIIIYKTLSITSTTHTWFSPCVSPQYFLRLISLYSLTVSFVCRRFDQISVTYMCVCGAADLRVCRESPTVCHSVGLRLQQHDFNWCGAQIHAENKVSRTTLWRRHDR